MIPKTNNPEILEALQDVRQSWVEFRMAIDAVDRMSANEFGNSSAIEEIEILSTILARQADMVVQLYEADSTAKLNILRNIQLGFLFFALVLLAGGAWVTRRSVLKPCLSWEWRLNIWEGMILKHPCRCRDQKKCRGYLNHLMGCVSG
ncbi:MAG: hypothetical protein IPJ47_09495 [Anaerolineales bacterium]|nr:hypothetical protein [Anaerolineales bacterium]